MSKLINLLLAEAKPLTAPRLMVMKPIYELIKLHLKDFKESAIEMSDFKELDHYGVIHETLTSKVTPEEFIKVIRDEEHAVVALYETHVESTTSGVEMQAISYERPKVVIFCFAHKVHFIIKNNTLDEITAGQAEREITKTEGHAFSCYTHTSTNGSNMQDTAWVHLGKVSWVTVPT